MKRHLRPFARPTLWLVRLSTRNTSACSGSREGSNNSSRVSGRSVPSASRARLYAVPPTPPDLFRLERLEILEAITHLGFRHRSRISASFLYRPITKARASVQYFHIEQRAVLYQLFFLSIPEDEIKLRYRIWAWPMPPLFFVTISLTKLLSPNTSSITARTRCTNSRPRSERRSNQNQSSRSRATVKAIPQVGQVRVNAVAPGVAEGLDLLRLAGNVGRGCRRARRGWWWTTGSSS